MNRFRTPRRLLPARAPPPPPPPLVLPQSLQTLRPRTFHLQNTEWQYLFPCYRPASDLSTTTSGGAVAAGAANVGHNPLSGGALTSRQTSGSVLAVSALAALLAFSL